MPNSPLPRPPHVENNPSLKDAFAELFALIAQRSFQHGAFVLASGKTSPYYLDCRRTTLCSRGAYLIGRLLLPYFDQVDAVGGMTMGADPIVSAVLSAAAQAGRPLEGFLVRKASKGHGTGRQIEGNLAPWMRVALVEDVVTTGQSTMLAREAILAAMPSVQVRQVLALVDRNDGGREAFRQAGLPYAFLYDVAAFLEAN